MTPESVEKTRSELQATVDPNGTFKTPEEAKESIVQYLTDNGGGRDGLNGLAEQLGLKKEGDGVWKFNRPNMRLIADAVVKGWEFPKPNIENPQVETSQGFNPGKDESNNFDW